MVYTKMSYGEMASHAFPFNSNTELGYFLLVQPDNGRGQ